MLTLLHASRPLIHLGLHIAVPALVARLLLRQGERWRGFVILLLGLAIDVDHLLAHPVYDPSRCSIGFHPLHRPPAALVYALFLAMPRTRLWGLGLLIHLGLDALDCWWMHAAGS